MHGGWSQTTCAHLITRRPPSPQLINAAQTCVSSVILLSTLCLSKARSAPTAAPPETLNPNSRSDATGEASTSGRHPQEQQQQQQQLGHPNRGALARLLSWQPTSLVAAGAELAALTFVAVSFSSLGLQVRAPSPLLRHQLLHSL